MLNLRLAYHKHYRLVILFIVIIGAAIRIAHYPHIPPGLNQDEANSAYEAYAIAQTGCDKWGNAYPAYFPSWGSGQNALQTYLSVPFISAFGLSIFSARIVSLLLGIAALPLLFFCLRPVGRFTAALGTIMLAFSPWHFMLSRWALESNLLPFCMLLGCYTLSQAIIRQQLRWIIPCLLPFAMALYAYGTTAIVLPIFILLVIIILRRAYIKHLLAWTTACILFLIAAMPFGLSFIKNYILGHDVAWTNKLFFSTPMFAAIRLSQDNNIKRGDILEANINYLLTGCNDGTNYNMLPKFNLLHSLSMPLAIIAAIALCYLLVKRKRFALLKPSNTVMVIFLCWFISSFILAWSFELNVNRFNHFFIPCMALGAWLIDITLRKAVIQEWKYKLQVAIACFFILGNFSAFRYYFIYYPETEIKYDFNSGLEEALHYADTLHIEQVRITEHMPLPYVYTLFYLQYPPDSFRRQAIYEVKDGEYKVHRFGKYVFHQTYLTPDMPYGYVSRIDEYPSTDAHPKKVFFKNHMWEVGAIY